MLSVFVLSVAVFYISRLAPGDLLMSYYGERVEKMSAQEKEAARDKLGLNDSIHIQYLRWAENAARGDFGISFQYKQDVMEVIGSRIGFIITFAGALLLGVLCAWHEDSWWIIFFSGAFLMTLLTCLTNLGNYLPADESFVSRILHFG